MTGPTEGQGCARTVVAAALFALVVGACLVVGNVIFR